MVLTPPRWPLKRPTTSRVAASQPVTSAAPNDPQPYNVRPSDGQAQLDDLLAARSSGQDGTRARVKGVELAVADGVESVPCDGDRRVVVLGGSHGSDHRTGLRDRESARGPRQATARRSPSSKNARFLAIVLRFAQDPTLGLGVEIDQAHNTAVVRHRERATIGRQRCRPDIVGEGAPRRWLAPFRPRAKPRPHAYSSQRSTAREP